MRWFVDCETRFHPNSKLMDCLWWFIAPQVLLVPGCWFLLFRYSQVDLIYDVYSVPKAFRRVPIFQPSISQSNDNEEFVAARDFILANVIQFYKLQIFCFQLLYARGTYKMDFNITNFVGASSVQNIYPVYWSLRKEHFDVFFYI